MKKKFLWLGIIVLLFFTINSCTKKNNSLSELAGLPSAELADRQGRLILSLSGEPSVLNPILSTDAASSSVEDLIFDGLVRIDKNLNIIPSLASRWEASPDGKLWTFYLRKDVQWHDGAPFTAADVKFTFDTILDPKTNTVRRNSFIIDGQPIVFKVIDRFTIRAHLSKPFAPFLISMSMGIVPKHLLEKENINFAKFNRQPIGTGPFIFYEWKAADHITLLANKTYYRAIPKLNSIVYKIIPQQDASLIALRNREIDSTGIPPRKYEQFKMFKQVNVYDYDSLTYSYIGLNLANPLFSNKHVRQAMAYALDKKQITNSLFKGLSQPAYAPNAPLSWAYEPNVNKFLYNPEKAQYLLKKTGWVLNEKNILEKKGTPFTFTLLLSQGSPDAEKAALILQQAWKEIGIKMDIQVMEWSALLKKINALEDPKPFDAVMISWSLGLDPDGYALWHSSQYPNGFNFIKYQNKTIDTLLEKGRTTIDKEKRKKIYSKISKIIAEDQPYIFLWYPKSIVGINKRVGGYEKPSAAGVFLNPETVFVTR